MPFRILRNDITKMNTEAIVNTANERTCVGTGCDRAVYKAAGRGALLKYRKEKIGMVPEGEVFITPGFNLKAKYIIHAVSPLYIDGLSGEEEKLRLCYKKSLQLAKGNGIKSIAFPLISTGAFGYPKEEGMRIAVDEINAFLLENDMDIYLVVFDSKATGLGKKIYSGLEAYIDCNYVEEAMAEEYSSYSPGTERTEDRPRRNFRSTAMLCESIAPQGKAESRRRVEPQARIESQGKVEPQARIESRGKVEPQARIESRERVEPQARIESQGKMNPCEKSEPIDFYEQHESKLAERMRHLSDTFSEYLMYLIQEKDMTNAEVYKRAIVNKKVFSKIKNDVDYHPNKLTALCLCVGVKLNLDESKDLLARAGYALSPCDKTDIIFSYFIENKIYDMIELDIQLEEHGLPCIIS